MYVDYAFYASAYGGGLSEPEFEAAEATAEALVKYLTYVNGDIFATESDPVKRALCAAVDAVHSCNSATACGTAGIKSESNDGYSITRVSEYQEGETADDMLRRKVYSAIRLYLLPTGWLSRVMKRHDVQDWGC